MSAFQVSSLSEPAGELLTDTEFVFTNRISRVRNYVYLLLREIESTEQNVFSLLVVMKLWNFFLRLGNFFITHNWA